MKNSDRIVGGEDADEFEYPWMVLMVMRVGDRFSSCGGSVINTR